MKKLYLLTLLFFACCTCAFSQSYIPLLDSVNIWHYTGTPITVRLQPPAPASAPCTYPGYFGYSKMHYTVNDTVIDSLTYKIVREERDLNPNHCDFGYVREDTATRTVYFRNALGDPEILLYDFSLQVGDTFNVVVNFGGYFQNGPYRLDSISTFHTGLNTTRRLFCLNPLQQFGVTMYWGEGIGCLVDAFYAYGTNDSGFGSQFWQCRNYALGADGYLTCFDHAQRQYFDSCQYNAVINDACYMVTDSCSYGNICGSVQENLLNATIEVYPNPASECLRVTFESQQKGTFTFSVFDVSGNLVLDQIPPIQSTQGIQTFAFDISSLKSGSYLLQCSSNGASVSTPFIVR